MDMHLNLSRMPPPGPLLELLSLASGDPNVAMGTAGLALDDSLRKLLPPGIGDGGQREVRTKPTTKAGASPLEAAKVTPGSSFLAPSLVRLIGDSCGKKTVKSGFSALEFERGGWPNGPRNRKMLPPATCSRAGQGTRNPSSLDSLPSLLSRGALVFPQRQLLGFQRWTPRHGYHG